MSTLRWIAVTVGLGLLSPTVLLAEHARTDGGEEPEPRVLPERLAPPSLILPYAPSPLRDEETTPAKRAVPPVRNVQASIPDRVAPKAPETPVAVPEPAPVPERAAAATAPRAEPEARVASVPAEVAAPEKEVSLSIDDMIERAVQPTKFSDENGRRSFDQCSEEDPEVKRHPLLLFAARGNDRKVASLLDGGAKVNQRRGSMKRTALICAIENRRETTVDLLLRRGANPHLPNFHGTTPVAFAAVEKSPAMVRMLMKRGANPRKRNGAGYDAVYYAKLLDRRDIVSLLIRR